MKKIIAIALVVMLVAAFVPATLAVKAPTEGLQRSQKNLGSDVIEYSSINENGEKVKTNPTNVISNDDVSEEMKTIKASDFETQATWQECPSYAVEMMDAETTGSNGYYFSLDQGDYDIADNWYTERDCYFMSFTPGDPAATDPTSYQYEEGETVFVSYSHIKKFDEGSGSIVYFDDDDDEMVQIYAFGGLYEDYYGEEGTGISMIGSWAAEGTVNIKLTAPEDNYMFRFCVAVQNASLTEFGGWLVLGQYEMDYTELTSSGKIEVDEEVTTDIGSETDYILSNDFTLTNAALYEVELEAGEQYAALMDSTDNIGGRMAFLDENMDVIASTWIAAGALGTYSYTDVPLPIIPAVDGTYYILIGGHFMTDEGELSFTIGEWGTAYTELPAVDVEIDLDDYSTEDYIHYIGEVGVWGYFWYADYNAGELILMYPGNYEISGDGTRVFCDMYDGVNATFTNGSKLGSTWMANEFAPVSITVEGEATLEDDGLLNYTLYNYETATAGLYLLGDTLNVEGPLGIVFQNFMVHVACAELNIAAAGLTGSYTIAFWVTGQDNNSITLGKNGEVEEPMMACTMYGDSDGYFFFGNTFAEVDSMYRYGGGTPGLEYVGTEVTITTDGLSEGADYIRGDANQDGTVNTGDAVTVLRHAVGILTLSGTGLLAADMNEDGGVNTGDAVSILRYCVGN